MSGGFPSDRYHKRAGLSAPPPRPGWRPLQGVGTNQESQDPSPAASQWSRTEDCRPRLWRARQDPQRARTRAPSQPPHTLWEQNQSSPCKHQEGGAQPRIRGSTTWVGFHRAAAGAEWALRRPSWKCGVPNLSPCGWSLADTGPSRRSQVATPACLWKPGVVSTEGAGRGLFPSTCV